MLQEPSHSRLLWLHESGSHPAQRDIPIVQSPVLACVDGSLCEWRKPTTEGMGRQAQPLTSCSLPWQHRVSHPRGLVDSEARLKQRRCRVTRIAGYSSAQGGQPVAWLSAGSQPCAVACLVLHPAALFTREASFSPGVGRLAVRRCQPDLGCCVSHTVHSHWLGESRWAWAPQLPDAGVPLCLLPLVSLLTLVSPPRTTKMEDREMLLKTFNEPGSSASSSCSAPRAGGLESEPPVGGPLQSYLTVTGTPTR